MIAPMASSEPSAENPLQGSCLCGGVRFEVTAPFLGGSHCHCSRCRKHSGTFGETQGRVPREGFRLISGEELVRVYRPADDAGVKAFCSQCGSRLFGRTWPEGPEISVRFGALDGDPGIRPEFHTYVDSKAPWDELPDDGLTRYPGEPPARSAITSTLRSSGVMRPSSRKTSPSALIETSTWSREGSRVVSR